MTVEARSCIASLASALLALFCLSAWGWGGETVFAETFEATTLGSSPPDTDNWTITNAGGWFTADGQCVSTQNHTASGSQSFYSSGGNAGQGIGDWNNPGWGPVANGRATCWFYDDMASTKLQWVAVDNDVGTNWLAILVHTSTSATKYVYRGSMTGGVQVTTIDRTLGWHKVTWLRDTNNTTLFLDDVQVYTTPNTNFNNFSDFDLGSMSWDSIAGNTGMWFDDCLVERGRNQAIYRWYQNDSAETPTASAAEDTAITGVLSTSLLRLRLQLQNDMSSSWSGAYVGLRYRRGTTGAWTDFGAGSHWNYANGLGTDGNVVANTFLTGTATAQHFVESVPSTANVAVAAGSLAEWDFALQATASMVPGTPYYFKAVETDSGGSYLRDLISYPVLAQLSTTSSNLKTWTGSVDNQWSDGNNWSPVGVPGSTNDVLIPAAASNDCSANTGATVASLLLESGRALLLTTNGVALTVTGAVTLEGVVTHNSTATLAVTNGPVALSGTYTHSGTGSLSAAGVNFTVENLGQYDLTGSGATFTCSTLTVEAGGDFNQNTNVNTVNVTDLTIDAGGTYDCTLAGAVINIADDLTNNGSMLGTTGGSWRFTGAAAAISGSSTTTRFYDLQVNSGATILDATGVVRVLNSATVAAGAALTLDGGTTLEIANATTLTASGTFNITGTSLQDDFATIRAASGNYSIALAGDVDVSFAKIQDLSDSSLTLSAAAAGTTVFKSVIFENSQSIAGRYLRVNGAAWDGYTFTGLAFDEVGGGPDTTGTVEIDIAAGNVTMSAYGKSPTYSSGGGTDITTAGTVTWQPLAATVCDLRSAATPGGVRLSWRALSEWGCVAYRVVKVSPGGGRESIAFIPAGGKLYESSCAPPAEGESFVLEAVNSKGRSREIGRFPRASESVGAGK